MPTNPVKFSGSESPSVEELAGGMPPQINAVTDAAGAIRMRPGIAAWSSFPGVIPNASPVIGMSAWNGSLVYVTEDRLIWALLSAGNVIALSDAADSTTVLDGSLRPVFATTRTRIIIAGGGLPQKWEGTGLSARLGGNPPAFSHVTTIAQHVVGNASDVSGLVYWSDVGDTGAETWTTGLNFLEAATKQDPVIGLYENTNELVVLGTETIQMFSPDLSIVFSPSRTIEVGWGPPHSYIQLDEQFMGIDARRRAIVSNGRSFEVTSSPAIGRQLDEFPRVDDCWGMRHSFHNYDFAIFNFPSAGRSFSFETTTKAWSEWKGYDSTLNGLGYLGATSSYFWSAQNTTLVGLATGQIAILDANSRTDLGNPITVRVTSAFQDRGTYRQKKCNAVYLKFRRGIAEDGTEPKVLLEYRDDTGKWGEPFRVYVGNSDDPYPVVMFRSLGIYRVRQWRITTDSVTFSFAGMDEDYSVLDT